MKEIGERIEICEEENQQIQDIIDGKDDSVRGLQNIFKDGLLKLKQD